MSDSVNGSVSSSGVSAGSPEALREDIERQREQLAATVDELHERLDPRQNTRPFVLAGVGLVALLVVVAVWRKRG